MKPLSIFFYGLGMFTLIISIIQWRVWYYDTSQFLFGSGISVLIIMIGFLYGLIREIQDEQEVLGKTLSEIINKEIK